MERNIREHGHHVNNTKDADKIKKCVLILDRLMEDEYHESAFKNHYKKWGHPSMSFKDYDKDPEMQEMLIKYPNVKTVQDQEQESKEFRICSKFESDLREQDLDILFSDMRKHIQTWWD